MPLRGVTDQEGTLEDYCFALSDFDSEAIWNTVNNLRSGKIEEASKDFCPKAPKLAEYVRSEQKRLDILKAPKAIPYIPAVSSFKDWRIIQRARTDELSAQGFRCIAVDIGLDEMVTKSRRKTFPAGTIWFWCLQEAWGPAS